MKEQAVFPLIDKIPKRFRKPVYAAATSFGVWGVAATCGGGDKPLKTSELQPRLTYSLTLPFAAGETWWYTAGPHYDENSKSRVKYAVDMTPTEKPVSCLGGIPYMENPVRAIADGVVRIVGDEKDPKHHSVVEVDHGEGFTSGYIHLDEMQVAVNQTVTQGAPLGYVSCEFPPGGSTFGEHLHLYGEINGKPIEVDRLVMSGWTIRGTGENNQGTMTKSGQAIRTADTRRCGPQTYSIRACNPSEEIRNDISWRDPHEEYIATPVAQTVPTKVVVPTAAPVETVEVPQIPTVERKIEGESIDFSLKNSSGQLIDISEDARFANKPILVFYYGRKFGPSDISLSAINRIKDEFANLAIMPVILENNPLNIEILSFSFTEVFIDESNVQSEASIALRIQGYPSTVILDQDHRIVYIYNGAINDASEAQIRNTIKMLEQR